MTGFAYSGFPHGSGSCKRKKRGITSGERQGFGFAERRRRALVDQLAPEGLLLIAVFSPA